MIGQRTLDSVSSDFTLQIQHLRGAGTDKGHAPWQSSPLLCALQLLLVLYLAHYPPFLAAHTHLLDLCGAAWSPVWLMPVRVTPSMAFFFSLRLRVRFRSADHSWAQIKEFVCGGGGHGWRDPPATQFCPPVSGVPVAALANLRLLTPKAGSGKEP